jgi:hypothetical protein
MQSNTITVIPVYNGERFLLRTLQSVAAQTVRPDRLSCSTIAGPTARKNRARILGMK